MSTAPKVKSATRSTVRHLWILRPVDNLPDNENPWNPNYDKVWGFVICASSEKEARKLASQNAGDEKHRRPRKGDLCPHNLCPWEPWNDKKYSTCKKLTAKHPPGLVIQDARWTS